ncbi:MAG: hypothetical protein HQL12_03910 [Candidatus Omnitrophica bacterium]|nr:hypothetical protein [Candidatus Omnitrophota bacterium]
MSLRFCLTVIRAFVWLFFASTIGSMAIAQQDANNSQQQIMTPASDPNGAVVNEATESRKILINHLALKEYEVVWTGNLSLCADDQGCLGHAKRIKSWVCAAGACDGKDKSKKPLDCFEGVADKYSKEVQEHINLAFCSLIASPSHLTRQAVLTQLSDLNAKEEHLVEGGASLLALRGSAESCENYIKDYVGAYGPQWGPKWYRALSGCRILTGERPREQEEKDFYTWFGVLQGTGSCSGIINTEMSKACNAPQAASPVPSPAVDSHTQ